MSSGWRIADELTDFSVITVDYGKLYVGRGEAGHDEKESGIVTGYTVTIVTPEETLRFAIEAWDIEITYPTLALKFTTAEYVPPTSNISITMTGKRIVEADESLRITINDTSKDNLPNRP